MISWCILELGSIDNNRYGKRDFYFQNQLSYIGQHYYTVHHAYGHIYEKDQFGHLPSTLVFNREKKIGPT